MALAKLPNGVVKIAVYLSRRCRLYGNVAPRQVLKKVFGTPAVVVDDDRTISLFSETRSELIDQSAAVVWQRNLLAKSR